jgi:hypothetical protein
VVGAGQIVAAVGPILQIATPALVEPGFGATPSGTDVLDGSAGEAAQRSTQRM